MDFSLEQLEKIVGDLAAEASQQRAKLFRLVAACARIIALQSGKRFGQRWARHHGDEAGHWDNSFPPAQVYSDYTGPRLIKLRDWQTEDVATSSGFYYDWRRVTKDPGLFVDARGNFWGAEETGEGRVGQFAAYPGDCGVDCAIEWREIDGDEVSTEDLEAAFLELGKLAFPLAAKRLEVAGG